MTAFQRARIVYTVLTAATILAGLTVHYQAPWLPAFLRDSTGDALWATMIAWAFSAIAVRQSLRTRSAAALALCFAVEFSQLWHTPALNQLRATRFGPLVLGSGFDWRDLVSYAIGVLLFALIDRRWITSREHVHFAEQQ